MLRRIVNVLMVVALLTSLVTSAALARPADPTPAIAKTAPVALGSATPTRAHLVAPREDLVQLWLTEKGAIPLNATEEQKKAALADYYNKFYKKSPDWITPGVQADAVRREAQLAQAKSLQAPLTVQPVTATVMALAVDFSPITETITLPNIDKNGNCITGTQTIEVSGPAKGMINPPDPRDNNTVWYSPTVTADPSFYRKLVFGYEGVGRTRFDLTDPLDGKPGIDLSGYTVQDYYDHVAGVGNVNLAGDIEGWVSVPHSEAYYGAYRCGTESTGSDNDGGYKRVGQLVVDAVNVFQAAHPEYYTDTSESAYWPQLDQNHDGKVDAFWIIHAGMGEEAGGGAQGSDAIWSHSWALSAQGLTLKVYEGDDSTTADDIYIDGYTMQPENLDLGVVVEEFGHNFFKLPDLYTNDGQNSTGFWSEMSGGSWGGYLGGAQPVGMPLWFRMIAKCGPGINDYCNWQEPMVTRAYDDMAGDVVIGQLESTPAGVNKGVMITLPDKVQDVLNEAGTGKAAWSGTGRDDMNLTLSRDITLSDEVTQTLTIDSAWNIEPDYDYGYVKVVSGTTTSLVCDLDHYMTTTNPNGGNQGCGLTDTGKHTLRFDLSAYKGHTVTLQLNYVTDPGTTQSGWWIDNVALNGLAIDDFEAATDNTSQASTFPGWTNSSPDGFIVVPFTRTFPNYYLAEWRSDTKYDKFVRSAYVTTDSGPDLWRVERVPYNIPGALLYYRDATYGQTYYQQPFYGDGPSYGPKNKLLVVDMNYNAMRLGSTASYLNSRASSYDAALTVQPSTAFTITHVYGRSGGPFTFASKPAVTAFHDAKGYYPGFYFGDPCDPGYICPVNLDGSAVLPAWDYYSTRVTHFDYTPYTDLYGAGIGGGQWLGTGNPGDDKVEYGVHVQLVSKTADNSQALLHIWNQPQQVNAALVPSRLQAQQRAVLTYTYTNNNIGERLDSLFMVIPINTAFVSYVPGSATGGLVPLTTISSADEVAKAYASGGMDAVKKLSAATGDVTMLVGNIGAFGTDQNLHMTYQVQLNAMPTAPKLDVNVLPSMALLYKDALPWVATPGIPVVIVPAHVQSLPIVRH